jgi:ribose transport system substrate-binding protein
MGLGGPKGVLLAALLWMVAPLPAVAADAMVGFAQDTLANDWRLAQVQAVERELSKHPDIDFIVTDARGSTALQAQHIRELARKVDVLITSPRAKAVLSEIIADVYAQGTPVILLSRTINGDSYTSFVHADNAAIGRQAGEFLADKLAGEGTVLMLEGIVGTSVTAARTSGFMSVMSQYSGIEVVSREGNFLRADSIRAVRALLEEGDARQDTVPFDAIFAQSDSMAEGARMALKQAGLSPTRLPIVGIDYIQAAREALLRGEQSLSFTYPTGGKEGAELAVRIVRGEPVVKEVVLRSVSVTADNARDVEPIF